VTDCVVAVAGRDQVDRDRLAELAAPRHREDPWTGDRSGVRAPARQGTPGRELGVPSLPGRATRDGRKIRYAA